MSEPTWEELARTADLAAQRAGASEAIRLMQRAADLALELDMPELDLFNAMALDRLMDLSGADRWSGRGNDTARNYRDGFVAKVRQIKGRLG